MCFPDTCTCVPLNDDELPERCGNDLLIKRLKRDYTKVKPCVVDGYPDAHTAWLVVDAQSFCITSEACESKEDAEMMCLMLSTALSRLLANKITLT